MEMYKVWLGRIYKKEVERTTKSMVFFKSKMSGEKVIQEKKLCSWHAWFDTREEAKVFLVNQTKDEVAKYEALLKSATKKLKLAEDL